MNETEISSGINDFENKSNNILTEVSIENQNIENSKDGRCRRKIKKTIDDEEWEKDDSYLCDFCDKRLFIKYLFMVYPLF